jgi:Terminase RNaseH-like domain
MSATGSIQILTPSGFRDFAGIKQSKVESLLQFTLENGRSFLCTENHKLVLNDLSIKHANKFRIGEFLSDSKIVKIDKTDGGFVYDPVNVDGGNIYLHDSGICSHNCAIGSTDTLIAAEHLLALKASAPIETIRSVKIYQKPIEGHRYVVTVDVCKGRGQDYSTLTVTDLSVRPFEQVATFRDNLISPLIFPDLIVGVAKRFNEALIVIENNDVGQVVCNGVYYDMEYENTFVERSGVKGGIGVTMTKRVKKVGCSFLKDLIEGKKLTIHDSDSILELSTFAAHGDSYQAEENNHDDLVMNLVMLAWFLTTPFAELKDGELKEMLFAESVKAMEDELVPAGFLGGTAQGEVPRSIEVYSEMLEQQRAWDSL